MTESLLKLRTCCGQLASDRVSDRKKQIEIFKSELAKPSVCRQLDQNSQNGRGMVWEHCFEAVRNFMKKEVEHVKRKQGKSNFDHKKLLTTGTVFKWFVQKANSSGENLKIRTLVDHTLFLMGDEMGLLCYGMECCMVVSKELLESWKYRCSMTSKCWQDFLKNFCKCLLNPPEKMSLDLLANLVQHLFAGAAQHANIRKGLFFSFFKQIISKFRSDFSGTMVSTVLGALNIFCVYAAADSRSQVCSLGEDSILTILHIWEHQSSSTKETLVEFLHLQMRVHHPKGALTEAEGAMATSLEHWKSLVQKMYEVLYTEWTQASSKLKLKGYGAKEGKLSASLVEFAADVCHQVFAGPQEIFVPDSFEASSQGSTPKRKITSSTTAAKRRKLKSGWEMLRDHMTQAGQSPSIIPWLQLAEALIPRSLPAEEIPEFLEVFVQLQSECKRGEIHTQLLLCLNALAVCQSKQCDQQKYVCTPMTSDYWSKIWAATIRMIGLRTAEEEGFSLLSTLLMNKLVIPGYEIWELVASSIVLPTQHSIRFVSVLLANAYLPEKHSMDYGTNSQLSRPLREQLTDWLFSAMEAQDAGEGPRISVTSTDGIHSTLLARVICSLICKSPKSVLADGDALSHSSEVNVSPLDEIEELFLCSSFDASGEETSSQEHSPPPKETATSLIPEMLQYLMGKLSQACISHQQIEFLESTSVQSAIQFSAVAVKVLTLLVAKDIVPFDDGSLSQLMRSIKALLTQLAESMKTSLSNVDVSNKDEILQAFHPAMKNLVDLFCWSLDHSSHLDKERRSFADVIQTSFSPDLLDLLMTFVINRGIKKKDDPSKSSQSRHFAMDDFDDEFDTVPSRLQDSEEDEFAIPQSSMGLDPESDTARGSKLTQHSSSDQFLLTVCTALAHCCQSLSVDKQKRNNSSISKQDLVKNLLQSFKDESWESKPPTANLQMVLSAVSIILKSSGQLAGGNIVLIIDIFRSISFTYRRDQDTCCKVLQGIALLIPRLAVKEGMTSKDFLSAREKTLHLLSAFWTFQKEGCYITKVRLEFAQCLQALLEVDPDNQWSSLRCKEEGQGDSVLEVQIRDILAAQLTDRSHLLRVHIAKNIKSFFHGPGEELLSKDDQNLTFDLLYETLQKGMTLEGKLKIHEQADEASNRTATMLVGLSCIAKYSPACLKKVVFALIQAIKVNGLEIHVVQKVLNQIWKHWGYKDSQSFMEDHLGYLVDEWLQLDNSLMEFPHHLLDCQSLAEFYRKYHTVLVPYLLLSDKMDFVKTMADTINEDWTEMVKASFPCTIAFVLPLQKDEEVEQTKRNRNAALCLDNLNSVLTKKVLENLIQSNLPNILVELLTRLYQPCTEDSCLKVYIRPTDPEPNSPYFSAATILATFNYLRQCFSSSGSLSLVQLLAKSQDSLQKILLALHTHIERSHTMEGKHRGLLAYHLFVKLVLKDLESGLGNSQMFVLRAIINMLTQTIKNFVYMKPFGVDESIRERCLVICVDTLRAVCESCLPLCSQELSRYLQGIIEVLVSLLDGAVREQSLALIHLLVVKSSKVLMESLKDIDPLPDLPQLQTAKDVLMAIKTKDGEINLLDEMNMFLMKEKVHSVGGLANLKNLLSERKDELAVLIGQCKDEGSDALVPKVIYALIKLCTESHSSEIQQQAAACLGEIGAPSMSLIALHSVGIEESMCYSTAAGVYSNDPRGCRNAILLHLLNKHLIQQDVDTIQAASSCLKNVFATASGQQFYEDYKRRNIDNLLTYLHPFKPNKKKTSPVVPVYARAVEDILSNLDSPLLWQPADGINHESWVKSLSVGLIKSGAVKDEILCLMEPVCNVKAAFAESVLPYLIHDILLSGDEAMSAILSTQMTNVFSRVCETEGIEGGRSTPPPSSKELGNVDSKVGKKCVRTLLQVVHYLRTQEKPSGSRQKGSPWENNLWLDINYLLLAKSAHLCQAHFTCLLYSEIWYNINKSQTETTSDNSDPGSQHSLETFSSNSEINVQTLLLEAYTSIGEPDGLYGCGVSRMTDNLARIHMYEHEGDWTSAMAGYDLISRNDSSTQTGLLQAMQNAGLDHILQTYLKGVQRETSGEKRLAEAQYEAAWRNGIWSIPDQSSDQHYSGIHSCLYHALCSIGDKDQTTSQEALERGRCFVSERLHHASLESVHSVYPLLTQMQVLKEVDEMQSVVLSKQPLESILEKWNRHGQMIETSFDFLEMTFNIRTSGLRVLSQHCPERMKASVQRGLTEQLLIYSEAATKARRFLIAEKSLAAMKSFEGSFGVDSFGSLQWKRWLQEAELFWAKSETSTALHLMKVLIEKLSKLSAQHETYKQIYPEALTLYGKWLAESRTESPHIIIENYLEKAVSICEVASSAKSTCMTSYLTLARFADAQYQHIVNYMKSPEYEAKKGILNRYRTDVEQLTAMGDMKTRYYRNLLKQGDLDEGEIESLLQDKARYLSTSVECYLNYLKASSAEQDIPVFRLCSLWFTNATDDNINKLMKEFVQKLPSSKFLPMLYQLAARMTVKTQEKQAFHTILQELIERAAMDHPYHTLPIILALANANKDAIITSTKKGGRLSRTGPQTSDTSHADVDRMQAASWMVDKLRSDERTVCIIRDMEKLSDAYIELAYWDVTQFKKATRPISFPHNLQICTLRNLKTAVSTLDVAVDPTCSYTNITTICNFESTFKLAGGINLPKIIMCTGSDGVKRRQLVKGRDDLRQDAVMQQVFGLVNHLLQQNPETRQRQLHIRRYKVMPLSQRSGILEWCEGTMPLGHYLLGDQKNDFGAHKRYRPRDKTSMQCRKLMQDAHAGDGNLRYQTFMTLCNKHFKPVFRHFFFEKFLEPSVWFEKRLAYSRSVATCSIVGYVVGLGDRHVQNILVDCNSAELVHIDLGVAFEQGRILPTPETIPFRLTRDLVDGMGVTGVEGVFRRCCEKTMDVMRNNQEALLAVLEVLLYDPLYDWTMSPVKALALQKQQDKLEADAETNTSATAGNTSFVEDQMYARTKHQEQESQVNVMAERALLRLQQKLQGLEEGVTLSVSGQVNHLIQEARDPKNLCRVFPGWQPWV